MEEVQRILAVVEQFSHRPVASVLDSCVRTGFTDDRLRAWIAMSPSAEVWKTLWNPHLATADPAVADTLVGVLLALSKPLSPAGSPPGGSTGNSASPRTPSIFAPARGGVGNPTSIEPQSAGALVSAYTVSTDQVARGTNSNRFGSGDRDNRKAQRLALLKKKSERKQQEAKEYKEHVAVLPPEKIISVTIILYRPGRPPATFNSALGELAVINLKHATVPLDALCDWACNEIELPIADRPRYFFADGLNKVKVSKNSSLADIVPHVVCDARIPFLLNGRKFTLHLVHEALRDGLVDCRTWVVQAPEEISGDSGSEFDDKPKAKVTLKTVKGKPRPNSDSDGGDCSDGAVQKVRISSLSTSILPLLVLLPSLWFTLCSAGRCLLILQLTMHPQRRKWTDEEIMNFDVKAILV